MLKTLLCICVSLLPLTLLSQQAPGSVSLPSEALAGDPAASILNFNHNIVDKSKVTLSWMVKDSLPDFFCIERSENGKVFEVVTVLNNLGQKSSFQWTDDSPVKGRSFYRIKYAFAGGPGLYSPMISVVMAGNIALKFYPNPVDHILIVRSDAPVDVQITDNTGKVRISEARVSGLHTINVSSLEKGVYLIRFTNKLTNVMNQEKLIKN